MNTFDDLGAMSRGTAVVARPPSARRIVAGILLATLVTVAAACGSSDSGSSDATTTTKAKTDTSSSEAAFPVTIENCGQKVTIDKAPTKAITMNQGATEIMLALGLQDHMVGTAYLDDAVLPEWKKAYDSVPVLAEEYPSKEVVLGEDPDFVYGSYESAFGDEGAGDRKDLEKAGIGTYLSPNDCRAEDNQPITFDEVFAEIEQVGQIFGVADRADALIADQKARIKASQDEIADLPQGTKVFWFDSGDDKPFTAGCCGAPAMIMTELGAANVFADLDGGWGDGSWETAVAADPDAIVLVDASWDTIDAKRKVLSAAPMNTMTAVKGEKYIEVPFSSTSPGVRNVNALEEIAAGLQEQLGG